MVHGSGRIRNPHFGLSVGRIRILNARRNKNSVPCASTRDVVLAIAVIWITVIPGGR